MSSQAERILALSQPSSNNTEFSPPEALLAQPSSTVVAPPSNSTDAAGIFERLRAARDKLLNETLANNPIQMAAAPVLERVASGVEAIGAMDLLASFAKGASVGSVLIPEDSVVEPEDPVPAMEFAGMLLGAAVEGAAGEIALVRALGATRRIAALRGAKNLQRSADRALDIFGLGEDATAFRRVMGGAALGGTTEVALQAAALQDPEQILAASGFVTVAGGALGGAIAAVPIMTRALVASPRFVKGFAEGVQQAETMAAAGTPAAESGVRRAMAQVDNIEALERASAPPRTNTLEPGPTTTNSSIEALFDQKSGATFADRLRAGLSKAHERFRESFVYEAKLQAFPSLSGVDGLTLADDLRVVKHNMERTSREADDKLGAVVRPLSAFSGSKFTQAWRAFERIVVLRDLVESGSKGLELPSNMKLDDLKAALLNVEATAPNAVLEAAANHKALVNSMRVDLVRRGRLEVGDGFDNYFPHRVIDDLADEDAAIAGTERAFAYPTTSALERGKLREPKRPYTRKRLGSQRAIDTDYIGVMHSAVRRWLTDNVVDDLISEISEIAVPRTALDNRQIQQINRTGRTKIDGLPYQVFRPRGAAYYRTQAVSDEWADALLTRVFDEDKIDVAKLSEELEGLREVLAVGRPRELILPAQLADRLEQFYQPDPLRRTILPGVQRATAWWKRNTIWWGLNRFFMFQLAGDSVNLLRSNPAAFLQIRNRRLDSPALRAFSELMKKHGAPIISKEQLAASVFGGVGGLALEESLTEDSPAFLKASAMLATAGLGYALGTRRLARASGGGMSSIYDEADKLAAIHSGFTVSEESVARRVLGESSTALPTEQRSPWLRSLDTVSMLLSGKAKGDPYNFLATRGMLEMVEVVQRERENWLRLASYMQMVESGTNPALAAKRARESLVDYGKFTDFENKVIRGFMLPFYAFYRHNTPNWIKAAVGRDVGGKATVAMAAVGAIAAGDIIAQMWNNTFFPDIESKLQDFRKDRFHIIVGNPDTGEAYTDIEGRPIIVGWEMPYETALEFFGLARPGKLVSSLTGMGGELEDGSLVRRFQRTAEDVRRLRTGPGKLALSLLNPFIKEPIQIALNKDLFYDAPIVPERYFGTPESKETIRRHVISTFFRQFREFQRTASEISGRRFDPATSAFGLGLPITRVDMNREIQGFIHEEMDEVQQFTKEADARWKKAIDDIIYDREDFGVITQEELDNVFFRIAELGLDPLSRERAMRYYMSRGTQSPIRRRYESMSTEEKIKLFNNLPPWAQTAFFYYLNFGDELPTNLSGEVSITGG